jgi:hypothetical protein
MLRATAFAVSLLLSAPSVHAQSSAEGLFQDGRKAAKRGDHATACRLFAESYAQDPAVGTLLNLARCDEELGRLAAAWRRYREVIERSPGVRARTTFAEKRMKDLDARLAFLTIRLGGDVENALVLRNGEALPAGELGSAIPVEPGPQVIEVRAEGRPQRRYELTLAAAQRQQLDVEPAAPEPLAATSVAPPVALERVAEPHARRLVVPAPRARSKRQPPDAVAESTSSSTLGWSLIGVGAAGLALSGVAALVVLDKKATVDAQCGADRACTPEGKRAADTGLTWSAIGTVAFVVGAASAGTGAYFVLTGRSDRRQASIGIRHAF